MITWFRGLNLFGRVLCAHHGFDRCVVCVVFVGIVFNALLRGCDEYFGCTSRWGTSVF